LKYPFSLISLSTEENILVSSKKDRWSFSEQLFHHISRRHLDIDPSLREERAWAHAYRKGTLHHACMVDDSETLNVLLGFSAPGGGNHLELKDVDGYTPIDLIVYFESVDCLKMLLKQGKISNDHTDARNWNMIHTAAMAKKIAIIVALVSEGAEVDTFTPEGFSALHLAVREGLEESVVCLLQSGANPNLRTKDSEKQPPANLCEDEAILGWLISYGARIDRKATLSTNWSEDDVNGFSQHFDFINAEIASAKTEIITKKDAQWMDDRSSEVCTLCDMKFTSVNRRHHCRACGRLCCGECSRRKLRFTGTKDQRACDVCVNKQFATSRQLVSTKTDQGELKLPPKANLEYKLRGKVEITGSLESKRFIAKKRSDMTKKLLQNVQKTKEIEERSRIVNSKADDFLEKCAKAAGKKHVG